MQYIKPAPPQTKGYTPLTYDYHSSRQHGGRLQSAETARQVSTTKEREGYTMEYSIRTR